MTTRREVEQQAADLQGLVWSRLGFRKWLVGRKAVDRITLLAIQQWPAMYAESTDAQAELHRYVLDQMRLSSGKSTQYGSIWVILLSAVISQAIQLLLKWWLERRENQDAMRDMRVLRGRE